MGSLKYIAQKKLKVGNKEIQSGEEIKNFRFFKPKNKKALLNMGWVEKIEVEEQEEKDTEEEGD